MSLHTGGSIDSILELKGQNKLCVASGPNLHIFDLSDGKLLFEIEDIDDSKGTSMAQIDDERIIISGSYGRICIVNVKEGKIVFIKKFKGEKYNYIKNFLKLKDDIFLVGLREGLAFLM